MQGVVQSGEGNLYFISGLPRAGSTLLAALLRQNPRIHAAMSGPLCPIYSALVASMSVRNEFHVFIDKDRRAEVLRGLFYSYYRVQWGNRIIFDTNRAWCSRLTGLATLFPSMRMICCVRSVSWILDSFERLVHANPLEPSKLYRAESVNVVDRIGSLTATDGIVGSVYNGLKEAFYGPLADRLVIVRYESLATRPAEVLSRLYESLGIEPFSHNFDNIEFDADEYDDKVGVPGLHRVRPSVRLEEREPIIPPDLFAKYRESGFWEVPGQRDRGVVIL